MPGSQDRNMKSNVRDPVEKNKKLLERGVIV